MPNTPILTVEVKEIRPCPDGTFNVVLNGAGCDLNFNVDAIIAMGLLPPCDDHIHIVKWVDGAIDAVHCPCLYDDLMSCAVQIELLGKTWKDLNFPLLDHFTGRIGMTRRRIGPISPGMAGSWSWETRPTHGRCAVACSDCTDVQREPSRTVAFEDLYRYVPIIRRADTLYHAVQWRPDDDSKSATRFQQVKTFVDQHSACDFSIHHQTTTDRLIIRRHDRSVPIVMEMGEWLIAEVETSQLTVVTPAEYNARYCEAP